MPAAWSSDRCSRFPHFALRPGRAVEYCERLRPVSGFYMRRLSEGTTVAATTSIVLIIREDPRTSARPVEALRIALGLAAGENPITVILMGQAVQLLAEDTDDIVDI